MPKIIQLEQFGGALWARIGKPGEFKSGVALYTPEEIATLRKDELSVIVDLIRDRQKELTR